MVASRAYPCGADPGSSRRASGVPGDIDSVYRLHPLIPIQFRRGSFDGNAARRPVQKKSPTRDLG